MEFNFSQLIVLALLIEAIVTTIAWVVDSRFNWQRVTALLVAVALAILANIDLFILVGLPLSLAFVGPAFTGLIIARGANAINDLFSAFKTVGEFSTIIPQAFARVFDILQQLPEPEEEETF
jgi:predicted Kef-type K+ transport protein